MFVAIAVLSIILIVLLSRLLGIRWANSQLLVVSLGVLIILHFLVPIALAIMGGIDGFRVENLYIDNQVLKYYGLMLADLTVVLVLIGYVMSRQRAKSPTNNLSRLGGTSLVIGMANIIAFLGLISLLTISPQTQDRLAYTSTSVFSLLTISRYMSYGATISVAYYAAKRRFSLLTILNGAVFISVYLLKLGDRAAALSLVLSLFFAVAATRPKAGGRLLLLGGLVGYVAISWQYVRWHWHADDSFNQLAVVLRDALIEGIPFSLGNSDAELNYLYRAGQALLAIVPRYYPYLYGSSYLRLFLSFVPSSLVPFKPPETQLIIADMFGVGIVGASRPATFVGDAYLNFGWFGPLAGLVLGDVVNRFEKTFTAGDGPALAVAALGPYAVVVWLRGSLNGIAVLAAWYVVLWVLFRIVQTGVIRGGQNSRALAG